jgi:hypothetical protein
MRLLSKPLLAGVRRKLSCRGGATDPHGRLYSVRVFTCARYETLVEYEGN